MTLPTVGASYNTHGAELNAHINIGHNANGTHKASEVTPVVTGQGIFGTWTTKDSLNATLVKNGVYKVSSDGFVLASNTTPGAETKIYTASVNPPNICRFGMHNDVRSSIISPIKKDDYWEVNANTGTPFIYWLPMGSGTCVKQ